MNSLQLRAILGYVTFSIKGKHFVQFFHRCSEAEIPLWDIALLNEHEAEAKMYTIDYKKVQAIAQELQFTITMTKRNGLAVYILSLWHQKQKIIAFICASLLLFVLSNTVWQVEVKGVPVHLEQQIIEQLKRMNVNPGVFRPSRLPVEAIESNIMETLPQLLYISVKKRGTIYTVEAVEKKVETPEAALAPRHLIAAKNGIIEKMLIKEGLAVVQINDFIKKGDMLVLGKITTNEDGVEVDDESEDNTPLLVAAEGKVYANTWYEVNVSSNLETRREQLQGEKVIHYDVNIGNFALPLKFWPKIKFPEIERTETSRPISIFKRKLPFTLIKRTAYDKKTIEIARTEDEAKQEGIEHALRDLQIKLGKEAEIIKYYILHEKVESGKVKLRLYVSVVENIAETQSISKEDN